MIIWSKYNRVFRSEKFGLMIYNSLSNRIMVIGAEYEKEIEGIQADPGGYDFSHCPSIFTSMIKNRILLGEKSEQDLIHALKKKRLETRHDRSKLDLTIMVTEDCNFGCPYCYEKNKGPVDMSPDTMDRLIEFIHRFKPLKQMNIVWFGGEPLMRFDRIQELNHRIQALDIPFQSAIITNGWLLTKKVTTALDSLNVTMIQVTIDGPPHIHNKKRFHLDHGDSFDRIQTNLDRLMLEEKWQGLLKLNYVMDKINAPFYGETFDYWTDRYRGCNVQLGANFADSTERGSRDLGCSFDREEEISFYLDQYPSHQGKGLRYFPSKALTGCCATHENAFVVGALGQLYKCWDDVGKKDMEVGSIHKDPTTWNTPPTTRYMAGVDPFDNISCQKCFYLPVCNACPNIQYRRKYKKQDIIACPNLKNHLPKFLEIHYGMKLRKGKFSL